MGNSEWVRLTPDDEDDADLLLVKVNDVGYDLAPGFLDVDGLHRNVQLPALFVGPLEALAFARQLPEVRTLLTVAKEAVEHINMCNDELIVPYVLMADTLAAAIADVEGER